MQNDAQEFYDLLYGRCLTDAGSIVACKRNQLLGFYDPCEINKMIRRCHSIQDCYFKPNLFDRSQLLERLRQKQAVSPYATVLGSLDEVSSVTAFCADCDAGKPGYESRDEMLKALNAMPKPPTAIVNSNGESGGFHCYWLFANHIRIDSEAERKQLSELASRWQSKLRSLAGGKLDATADLTRMLRFVGGMRSNGERVSIKELHTDRLYRLCDLALPIDRQQVAVSVQRTIQRSIKLGTFGDVEKPIEEFIREAGVTVDSLLVSHGYDRLSEHEWRRPGSQSGGKTFARATEVDCAGVNVFSTAAEGFENCKLFQFVSLADLLVRLEFGGDWTRAAKECRSRLERDKYVGINLEGILKCK